MPLSYRITLLLTLNPIKLLLWRNQRHFPHHKTSLQFTKLRPFLLIYPMAVKPARRLLVYKCVTLGLQLATFSKPTADRGGYEDGVCTPVRYI